MVALVALVGASATAGCIGSETRESFDEEVHARGGGLTQELVIDAVDAVEEDTGADTIKLRSFTTSAGRVSLEVQVPGSVEDLDSYSYGSSGLYGGGGLDGPDPVARSGSEAPLEAQVFTLDEAGIDRFDAMVDQAIAEADLPGGWASSASVTRGEQAAPVISVTVTNVRRTVSVIFAPDGTVQAVNR
jgi:hypothetical protein